MPPPDEAEVDLDAGADASFDLGEAQMSAWAEALGACLRPGDVLLLRGAMGVGKTTLTRALARGMGIERPERVCSPTYTLCMVHPGALDLVHLDLHRLGELGEGAASGPAWESLGLEHEELPGPGQALVVEWSELWTDPPSTHLRIEIQRRPGRPDTRSLRLSRWGDRWAARELPGPLAATCTLTPNQRA